MKKDTEKAADKAEIVNPMDTLFGRNQPKQLTAGKEADHE